MLTFKQFLTPTLLEGGGAIKNSVRITQVKARELIPKIKKHVAEKLGISTSRILDVGSAGRKPNADDTSGDVDLVIKSPREELERALPELGAISRAMRGIEVYSFGYPVDGGVVQVDLIPVKSLKFAKWSFQANPIDLRRGLKGAHRNELFFAIAKYADPRVTKSDESGAPLEIERTFYDLRRGVMRGKQTREGKKKPSKNFKTVEKTVIADDPVEVTRRLFGEGFFPDDVATFQGALDSINSPDFRYASSRDKILELAREGIKKKGLKDVKF